MQACLTDDSAVETSRGTRKDDIVLVGRCGYYGAITEVCGDDGNMEVEEMETRQQQHLILVICLHRARVVLALS